MTGKKAVPRKVGRIEAHKRKQAGRGRLGAAEEDGGGGAYGPRLQRTSLGRCRGAGEGAQRALLG